MPTIFPVEDTHNLASVVMCELEKEQYRVIHASDGLSALCLYEEGRPDIIILDWMLPGLDELAVVSTIRQSASTPILMLTARGEEVDRVLGLKMRVSDYETKPFNMRELIARIHVLLRHVEKIRVGASTRPSPDKRYSTTTYRNTGPRLRAANLHMSLSEFEVLYLRRHSPGRTCSARTYRKPSGKHRISQVTALLTIPYDAFAKLGVRSEHIETIRGIGYRLRRKGNTHALPSILVLASYKAGSDRDTPDRWRHLAEHPSHPNRSSFYDYKPI